MNSRNNLSIGRIALSSIPVIAYSVTYGVVIAFSFIGVMFMAHAYGAGSFDLFLLGSFMTVLITAWALWKIQWGTDSSSPEVIERDSQWETVLSENDDGYGLAAREVDGGVELRAFDDKDEVYNHVWIAGDELDATEDYLADFRPSNQQ